MLPLAGTVALVTGASSGIGRATAVALAAAGADVALNYLTMPDGAEAAAKEIRSLGRRAILQRVDVSDFAAVETMVSEIERTLGGLDHFVSSAVYSDREPFNTADLAGFHKTLDVSMTGAYYTLRAATNAILRTGRGGSAVIVSSPHAEIAFPNCMAYNMAKAATDQMMRTAATELLKHRIRVNAVYPGWTDTPLLARRSGGRDFSQITDNVPMGRMLEASEIAEVIHFLLSPAASALTGTTIPCDGGFLPGTGWGPYGGFPK